MKNLTGSLIVAIVTLFGASVALADNHMAKGAGKADAAATTSTPAFGAKADAKADAKAKKKAKKKKVNKAKTDAAAPDAH